MKYKITLALGLLFLVSCGKDQQVNTLQKTSKETKVVTTKNKNKTEDILKLAVRRMMPGGPLAKKQLSKLKIYKGETHPHEVQNPTIINFKDLNKKNMLRN